MGDLHLNPGLAGVRVKQERDSSLMSSFQATPSTSAASQQDHQPPAAASADPPAPLPAKATKAPTEIMEGLKLIHECGIKLEASRQTISNAFFIYHKFFQAIKEEPKLLGQMVSVQDLVVATCYYYSTKMPSSESTGFKLREIITLLYDIVHPNTEPIDVNGEEYSALAESITRLELVIGRYIKFQEDLQHPHPYLLSFNRCLNAISTSDKVKQIVFSRTAWAVLNDFHFSPSCFNYDPEYVAMAVIEFTQEFCPLLFNEPDPNLVQLLLGSAANSPLITQIKQEIRFCYSWLRKSNIPACENS